MRRRQFLISSGAALTAGGLALAGCTTTPLGGGDTASQNAAKRASIDANVDAALARLYVKVNGSRELLSKATGVLVFPTVFSAGFWVGGQYGTGALRVNGRTTGYYSTVAGSFGLQIGAQSKAIIFAFMNQGALDDFLKSQGWAAGADATVAVMPLYHGHGLLAALLATLASGGTVLLPAGGRFSAHTFWDDIDAVQATWYTAVPTIHQILLERARTDHPGGSRALRFIRSCSAPLSVETAQALHDTFSAPVVCAFGMTEATHQVATTVIGGVDHNENPAATPGLVGRSTGPEIRIVGPEGHSVPAETVGEVWLHGPTVVRGYLGDPAITAANFTDGWLRTGDLGSLSAAGDLTIRGRIKELINRGGEKISPEHVEGVLGTHPDVQEVAVFGEPDKLYGETVAAVIVPRGSSSPTPAELAEFCRKRLAPFEVPATFQQASALPHTAKGSLDRRAVAQQFGSRA